MKIQFSTHNEIVAACEQLADDLVDFSTNLSELQLTIEALPTDYNLSVLGDFTILENS